MPQPVGSVIATRRVAATSLVEAREVVAPLIAAELEVASADPELTPLFVASNCDARPEEITDPKIIVAART
eukprot:10455704-Prorocentrum_lima.AAC.1